jgi:hypothetical protein
MNTSPDRGSTATPPVLPGQPGFVRLTGPSEIDTHSRFSSALLSAGQPAKPRLAPINRLRIKVFIALLRI